MTGFKCFRRPWALILQLAVFIIIGIIVSNTFAEQVTLAWNPNAESDLAGYRIHHGTASGSYSVHIDVHNVTSYTVAGLTAGQTYYFVATAYDTSGNESAYSNQVRYTVPTSQTPSGRSTPWLQLLLDD